MSLGPWEIALIVLVIFLLFGATRLPNAARSLGRSMRIFKSEMDEMKTDKKDTKDQAIEQQRQVPEGPVQDVNDQAQPSVAKPQSDHVAKPEGDVR